VVELRRILCPTDFSDVKRHALEHAIVIAGWCGSQIVALHVGHPTVVLSTAVPIPLFTRKIAPGNTHRQPLEEELRRWLSPATATGLQTYVIVDEGHPASRILEHAKSLPADLIVMGTHG
jgi:universal stress protein A